MDWDKGFDGVMCGCLHKSHLSHICSILCIGPFDFVNSQIDKIDLDVERK